MPFFSRYDWSVFFSPLLFLKWSIGVSINTYICTSDMVWEQVNQIGSVTESIEAVKMSKRAGWGVMASHRRFEVDLEYCRHGVI